MYSKAIRILLRVGLGRLRQACREAAYQNMKAIHSKALIMLLASWLGLLAKYADMRRKRNTQ
jgi:hypothetical protein